MSASTRRMPVTRGTALGFGAALLLPVPLALANVEEQSDPPEKIHLTGVVRDFHEKSEPDGHPDMENKPDKGFGHYAGNVAPIVGGDGKPIFIGQGYRVDSDWKDSSGKPMAPHMYNASFDCDCPETLEPKQCLIIDDNFGTPAYEVCFEDAVFHDDGTSSWTYKVSELETGAGLSHFIIVLDEDVHEIVNDGVSPSDGWTMVSASQPHYDVSGIKWDMSDSFTTGLFTVQVDGHWLGEIRDDAVVIAKGGAGPSGNENPEPMFGPTTEASTSGLYFKVDFDNYLESGSFGDSPGSAGPDSTGGVTSAQSFDQWFNDDVDVNISMPLTLTLEREGDKYVFDDRDSAYFQDRGGFFPIDGELFGNSKGEDTNFHFTFELHTTFTYDENGSQYFTFIGDDDVWVFIDGKLAIDLGGVHSAIEQSVDLTRFCLQDGEEYKLSFFFAERHRTESNFRIETNIDLDSDPISTITSAFD